MNILQEEKGFAVVYILILQRHCVYFIYCLFVTLLISSCQDSYDNRILINSQRARAFRIWHMHMQIIAVGVTNRRDQQKVRFRGPFWTALTHVRAFSFDF